MIRRLATQKAALLFLFLPLLFLALWMALRTPEPQGPLSYADIPGWQGDVISEALPALQASCAKQPAQSYCAALQAVPAHDEKAFRAFFESHFTPYAASSKKEGLFTGYYEASLRGSLKKGGRYQTPLWGLPRDLLRVELGAFQTIDSKQTLYGKEEGLRIVPYDDRSAIAAGSLKNRAAPVVWVDDPIEAFFLEVQGSGRIALPNGEVLSIGFAGKNGQPYVSLGRVLLDQKKLSPPVTADAIKAWLREHPAQAQAVMNQNPSVTFFKIQPTPGPIGAQGVPLTPGRSLAVDPAYIQLGTPVWLMTDAHRKLMIAQDTGSAIKGAVRGDYFWGFGPQAERAASAMQERGTFILFLPRGTARL